MLEYQQRIGQPKMQGAFSNIITSTNTDNPILIQGLTDALAITYKYSGKGLHETAADMVEKSFRAKLNALEEGKSLLINQAGGWCPLNSSNHEIVEKINYEFIPVRYFNTGL